MYSGTVKMPLKFPKYYTAYICFWGQQPMIRRKKLATDVRAFFFFWKIKTAMEYYCMFHQAQTVLQLRNFFTGSHIVKWTKLNLPSEKKNKGMKLSYVDSVLGF